MLSINDTINLINKILTRAECSHNYVEHSHLRALAEHMIEELRADLDERPYRRGSDDRALANLVNRYNGEF